MSNKSINYLITILSILFLFTFNSCQENMTEPTSTNANIKQLEKDPPLRIPDTYVHGTVTKDGSPVQGVKVELWKDGNILPYDLPDEPYTNSSGYYSICVCCKGEGTGTYTVKAQKKYSGEGLLSDSETFYWNHETGPWDFTVNLQLGLINQDKLDN